MMRRIMGSAQGQMSQGWAVEVCGRGQGLRKEDAGLEVETGQSSFVGDWIATFCKGDFANTSHSGLY